MGNRLLVLDADAALVKEHMSALRTNFEADFINAPDKVVELLEGGQFGCLLVNVEKGEGRGFKVCQTIRRHPILSEFKIAAISTKETRDHFAKNKDTEFLVDLYLIKPIASPALISALKYMATGVGDRDELDSLLELDIGGKKEKGATHARPKDWSVMYDSHLIEEMERKISGLEARLHEKTMELLVSQQEMQEVVRQNRILTVNFEELEKKQINMEEQHRVESEGKVRDLKAKLHEKTLELLMAQQDIQELQRTNDTITVNFEELEKQQKDTEGLHERLHDAEKQLKRLKADSSKREDSSVLRQRLIEAVGEKQELLKQLEILTYEVASKHQHVVSLMQSKEQLQEQLLKAEARIHTLESEFDYRMQTGQKLLNTQLDALHNTKDEVWKRITELEESYSVITGQLDSARENSDSGKKSLAEGLDVKKETSHNPSRQPAQRTHKGRQ
ncbi:MAG: hypothetical protein FWG02_07005 [Holophagaceae bacterium]|nr:hypothetical protein [Holophagaceae bacterium]